MGFTNVYGVPQWGRHRGAASSDLGPALGQLSDWTGAWVIVEHHDRGELRASLERIARVTLTRRAGAPPTGTIGFVGQVAELELDAGWSATAVTSKAIALRRSDGWLNVNRP